MKGDLVLPVSYHLTNVLGKLYYYSSFGIGIFGGTNYLFSNRTDIDFLGFSALAFIQGIYFQSKSNEIKATIQKEAEEHASLRKSLDSHLKRFNVDYN
jgi:hypothetical protein